MPIPTDPSRTLTLPTRAQAAEARAPYRVLPAEDGWDVVASDGVQVAWFTSREAADLSALALNTPPAPIPPCPHLYRTALPDSVPFRGYYHLHCLDCGKRWFEDSSD